MPNNPSAVVSVRPKGQLENKDSSDNGAFTSHVKSNWKKWFTDDFKGGSPNIEDLYGNMWISHEKTARRVWLEPPGCAVSLMTSWTASTLAIVLVGLLMIYNTAGGSDESEL